MKHQSSAWLDLQPATASVSDPVEESFERIKGRERARKFKFVRTWMPSFEQHMGALAR